MKNVIGKKQLTAVLAMACTLSVAGIAQAGLIATYDWAEVTVGGSWWYGYGYTETENGLTLVAGGRAASIGNGVNGRAMKASYVQDADPGTFDVEYGGNGVNFTVLSIDISSNIGAGDYQGGPLVQGMLGGVEQWSITPTPGIGYQTFVAATSGDMSIDVDQLVWSSVWDDPGGAVWNNEIDNLTIEAVPEPTTIGLLVIGVAGMFVRRRMTK